MKDREVGRWRAAWPRRRYSLLAVAAGIVALAVASISLGDSPGPMITLDQGFNSGQPLSPSFPPDGSGGSAGGVVTATVIEPDGKIVVVGENGGGGHQDFDFARYNPDGTLDTSFGSGGYVQVDPTPSELNRPQAIALDPQTGDIVALGECFCGSGDVPELVRLTPSGALDGTFGTDGVEVDNADAGHFPEGMVIDSSSRIVTISDDGEARRYTSTGVLDSSFGTGGHTAALVGGEEQAIALQPDGKILVAGTSTGSSGDAQVVRLDTHGSLDGSFGTGGTAGVALGTTPDAINSIALEGTSILIAGSDNAHNTLVARLTSTGTLDSSFGSGGFDSIAPPSGDTQFSQVVFYDPNPGILVCWAVNNGASFSVSCKTFGVDGGSPSPADTFSSGGPFNGAAAISDIYGKLIVAGYQIIGFTLTDGGPPPPPPNGTGVAPPPQTGVCDWVVSFLDPQQFLDEFPASYHVQIENKGSGRCPAANLEMAAGILQPEHDGGSFVVHSEVERVLGEEPWQGQARVPSLAPGEKYVVTLEISNFFYTKKLREYISIGKNAFARVGAFMPLDADGAGESEHGDEHANERPKLRSKLFEIASRGVKDGDAKCPSNYQAKCEYVLDLIETLVGKARDAAASNPPLIGSADGTVRPGRQGLIPIKLTKAGRELLDRDRQLRVTAVGTRTQGDVELLVEGHFMLSLR